MFNASNSEIILLVHCCRLVWSLLVNGVLLAWDPETRTRVFKVCGRGFWVAGALIQSTKLAKVYVYMPP